MLPITFQPIYQQRVWGGRQLEHVYNRDLPSEAPYGESWEISDRELEQSMVVSGIYGGITLNELWNRHRDEVFGMDMPVCDRFPLLIKILDARSDLSIQVHPTESVAEELGGDAKAEMWYIAAVDPGAKLYVGLKNGTTKDDFEQAVQSGTVEDVVHAITPSAGESIFIESGRLHAIGAGFLIYEIQQNSDTTYRVFDWNRVGLDGHPRELHVDESMRCIDFEDFEPSVDQLECQTLASCEHFLVDQLDFSDAQSVSLTIVERFAIISIVHGALEDTTGKRYKAGDFFILPAFANEMKAIGDTRLLETTIPTQR